MVYRGFQVQRKKIFKKFQQTKIESSITHEAIHTDLVGGDEANIVILANVLYRSLRARHDIGLVHAPTAPGSPPLTSSHTNRGSRDPTVPTYHI